jgi:signal transduction histidine kinase
MRVARHAGLGVPATSRLATGPRARLNPGALLALVGCASASVLIAVGLRFGSVRAPGLCAALETMMTLFAFAAAWLLRVRFASSRRLRDLLLVAGAVGLGLTSLSAAALPAVLNVRNGAYFSPAAVCGQLAVGALFATAAFTRPDRLLVRPAHPVIITVLLGLGALLVAGLGGVLLYAPGRSLLLVLALAAAAPLLAAAVGFARRRREDGYGAAALLASALPLLGAAGLIHVMARAASPGRISLGEAMRVLAFALLLAVAVSSERRDRRRLAKSAALAERRRVARDLHDGLAQDLAFIAAHAPSMAEDMGHDHPVVVAARRALAVSRSTISELTAPEGASPHESLEAVAQELRDRFEVRIAVDAHADVDLKPDVQEHVTRIAREAIANAARHGRAQNVVVSLRRAERGVALRVLDDGCGMVHGDGDAPEEGFGLTSMRERAGALGGYLRVGPARRGGTELEVVLP